MKIIADLHLHSKYSRAVSAQMVLPQIGQWADIKGIDLVGTGDFTHPLWSREAKMILEEAGEGIYKIKGQDKPLFLLTGEISSIYSQEGKLRRVHNLVLVPNFEEAEKINQELARRGNLMSDGRPIFGLSARDIADLILSLSPQALIIPAHIWTPHFSLYGSESGFDSLNDCFGNMSKYIYAIETGLSSDPAMNWRIEELDNQNIVSFSDAHSGAKLGREATVFEIEDIKKLRYEDIRQAIIQSSVLSSQLSATSQPVDQLTGKQETENRKLKTDNRIAYTIEFYPEEGKYHFTGHRNCGIRQSPEETKNLGTTCPVCGKGLTVGVMHRVGQLAARELKTQNPKLKTDINGVRWIHHPEDKRPPYVTLVPLLEILAESLKTTIGSQKAINEYKKLTGNFGGEFGVLLNTPVSEIAKISGPRVAEGIKKVRSGEIVVEPGYDGVFGTVKIWPFAGAQGKPVESEEEKEQLALF